MASYLLKEIPEHLSSLAEVDTVRKEKGIHIIYCRKREVN